MKAAIGDLDRVQRVVRLGGFINATPDFLDTPKVMNGASDLMVAAFGDKGRHARTTIGVAVLPLDAAVEVEGMFEIAQGLSMSGLSWLVERPVAHRGLHDAAAGIIENTPSAVSAAVAGNYAIEVDLQITADGEAIGASRRRSRPADRGFGRAGVDDGQPNSSRCRSRSTADRMMTLSDLCDLVDGRSTLVIELKSLRDGDLARRPASSRGAGRVCWTFFFAALMSFDPFLVRMRT